ncbi:MAG: hypothetical protein K9H26_18780 [Prolixibacteraceae bacterium]|nr:hypothetical protein [Prolixibacteraceae bacterium]
MKKIKLLFMALALSSYCFAGYNSGGNIAYGSHGANPQYGKNTVYLYSREYQCFFFSYDMSTNVPTNGEDMAYARCEAHICAPIHGSKSKEFILTEETEGQHLEDTYIFQFPSNTLIYYNIIEWSCEVESGTVYYCSASINLGW